MYHHLRCGVIVPCRAILGSAERMFAILTEHWGGKWPLWVSPRQCMVVPISGVCAVACVWGGG